MRKKRSDAGSRRVQANYRTFTFRLNVEKDADVIEIIDQFVTQRDEEGKPLPLHLLILQYFRGTELQPSVPHNIMDFFTEQLAKLEETIEKLSELNISATTKTKKNKAANIDPTFLSNLKKAMRGEGE